MATVGQLMTKDLSVIGEEASIQEAARQMQNRKIGSLLVQNDQEYVGIITETDVVRAVAEEQEIGLLTVQGLMSSPIIAIETKLSPQYARDLMADRHIRHLVVRENDIIVGMISVRDLLGYFKTVAKNNVE